MHEKVHSMWDNAQKAPNPERACPPARLGPLGNMKWHLGTVLISVRPQPILDHYFGRIIHTSCVIGGTR